MNLHEFYWELKCIYINITREVGTPNIWGRKEYTTPESLEDVERGVKKYLKL